MRLKLFQAMCFSKFDLDRISGWSRQACGGANRRTDGRTNAKPAHNECIFHSSMYRKRIKKHYARGRCGRRYNVLRKIEKADLQRSVRQSVQILFKYVQGLSKVCAELSPALMRAQNIFTNKKQERVLERQSSVVQINWCENVFWDENEIVWCLSLRKLTL